MGPALGLWRLAGRAALDLAARGLTLATAESLSGGWLSAALTSVQGSSGYFMAGIAAYSNEAKMDLLGVAREALEAHGAVSWQVAEQMALGARKAARASIGLSTTGVAGPDGGSAEKPVGLVFVAAADGRRAESRGITLPGDRLEVSIAAAGAALDFLSGFLSGGHPRARGTT
jgi:nicotinamide-nucleotide amidase